MRRINTLEQLNTAALEKKAVVYGLTKRVVPAAFVIGMPGRKLVRIFESGLYIYERRGNELRG